MPITEDRSLPLSRLAADGLTAPTAPDVLATQVLWNGTGADRQRGNTEVVLLASAARAASANSADQVNYNGTGCEVTVSVTAIGTATLTVTIQSKDPASATYTAILTSASILANGVTRLRVHPSLVAEANLKANDILPRTWRVAVTQGGTGSATYSVGGVTIN